MAAAVASFVVARRWWPWAVVFVVVADVLTWAWIGWLKTLGNILYWGAAVPIAAAFVVVALTSRAGRRVLAGVVLSSAALLVTAAWSFERHTTLVAAVTLGSVLCIAGFAVVQTLGDADGRDRLAGALATVAPIVLVLTGLVIIADHSGAVAEGGGVSGVVNGPNSLGLLLALTVGFLLAAPALDRRPVALIGAIGIVAFVTTLSASRTGMLAGAVAVVVYELGMRRPRRLALVLAAAAGAGALAVAWVPDVPTLGRPIAVPSGKTIKGAPKGPSQTSQIFGGRVHGQSQFSSFVGARDEAWLQAVKLLDRRPLLGSGFGTGTEIFAHDHVRHAFRNFVGAFTAHANVHDAYLQALLELGIPGGLIFLTPLIGSLVFIARGLARGWRSTGEAAFGAAAAAAGVGAIFESLLSGFGAMTLIAWLSFAMLFVPTLARSLAADRAVSKRRDGRSTLVTPHASAHRP